jgi:hypothetical protein
MSREWCPRCQSMQNVNTTRTELMEKDEEGNDKKITVESYQCSACHMFIKSLNL